MTAAPSTLLADPSIEVTGRDLDALAAVAPRLAPGTTVNVTFLGSETAAQRIATAREVVRLGLRPVPHVSARRLRDRGELDAFLTDLRSVGASDRLMVIGGDPAEPAGPFPDALTIIRSGALDAVGAASVRIAGYPEGHPDIAPRALDDALRDKRDALRERGLDGEIITQFGFDAEAVLRWLERIRADGIDLPVRVGVAGPVDVRRLLGYARRFGIGANAMVLRKYGLSIGALVGRSGPDRFVAALRDGHRPEVHGEVALHVYTFGDLAATATWLATARR